MINILHTSPKITILFTQLPTVPPVYLMTCCPFIITVIGAIF